MRSSPKILITGGEGQLASAILHHPLAKAFNVVSLNRDMLDITQHETIEKQVTTLKPDFLINTAAYTAVDKAEEEKIVAQRINQQGVANLAAICEKYQIPLIHISTDYIFDGTHQQSYREEDSAHPINYYGLSKYLGEIALRERCEKHIILRVSAVFSEYRQNFFKTMLRLAQEKKELRVVDDQITCPTYASDIAEALFVIIKQPIWGTYHFASCNSVSWYDFASAIITQAKFYAPVHIEKIHPVTTAEFNTTAQRPLFSVLNCDKITKSFAIKQPSWEAALSILLAKTQGIL